MSFDGKTYRPVSPEIADKLAKMDKVIALLDRPEKWCKQQLRSYDGRRCMVGAMQAADATVALKHPILAAIESVTGRTDILIEMFNDHPCTDHPLVLHVLHRAREIIAEGRE